MRVRLRGGAGLVIEVPKWSGKWVVNMDQYAPGVVGAKSKNLAGLRGKLPDSIKLPSSVTLPFGCFEQVRRHSVAAPRSPRRARCAAGL